MRKLFRPAALVAMVLLVPLLPFLGWAGQIEQWYAQWERNPPHPAVTTALVIGSLATDIFLPIPSSVVSTLAGSQLGIAGATAASFTGMSIGAALGFAVARRWGCYLARWLASAEDMQRMAELTERLGPAVLVVTRPVPILAEAGVLLLGMNGLPWRKFLAPLLLSNLGLAFLYAVSGERLSFPYAMVGAVALPVLAACVVRWLWPEAATPEVGSPPAPPGANGSE